MKGLLDKRVGCFEPLQDRICTKEECIFCPFQLKPIRMSNRIVLISSTAAHRVLRHGHLPGFLRGGVAGLPYSAHQNQAQAEEESGNCGAVTRKSLNAALVLVLVEHACDGRCSGRSR